MAVIVPNFASSTEDRTSGAQVIDGSLKFNGPANTALEKTFSSAGNRTSWTWSCWVKRDLIVATSQVIFGGYGAQTNDGWLEIGINSTNAAWFTTSGISAYSGTALRRDTGGWYHFFSTYDGSTLKIYINNNLDLSYSFSGNRGININNRHRIGQTPINSVNRPLYGRLSQCYFIDGQVLTPESFAYTDPLTNTWRPKKYTGTFTGTNTFYLPLDGNSPIGEDKSGRGNNWTPVNFGGSNSLDKATGAKPILNTDGGGNVARPGVFGSEENLFYTVTTANGSVYQFDITSGNNPSLSFIRGATYRFDYTSHSSHPLRFSSTNPDSSTSAYTDGTNTSVSNVITITVPHNAPNTLYYYCTAHASGMNGSISVTTDETKADPYAWKCVLAAPLVGSIDDVSADINVTTTKKAATNYGSTDSSVISNFYGSSRKFDGSNDNINYAANADLGFDGDFTIECFCTPGTTGNDSNAVIASKAYYNANYNWYLKFNDQSGGKMTWYSYNGQGGGENLNVTNLGTTDANRIHHIAVTRESNVMRLYLDGVKVGNATFSRNYNDGATNGLTLARQPSGNSANSAYGWYDGHINDLRIYKGVAKYNGATTGVQYFIPASTNPDILPDSPSGVSGSSKLAKVTDGAVAFDGTTDDINVPSHSDITFGTGVFTIDCFVYFNSFDDTYPTIMSKYTNSISWIMRAKNNGKIIWYTTNGGGTNNESSTSPISLKKWHHIAVVREGTGSNQLKVYVDGTVAITMTDANDYNDSNVLCIGAQQAGGGNGLNGFISNVRLVKGTAVYTSDFTPPFRTLTSVTNTKLLCCQSPTSATAASVIPTGSITANGNAVATNFNPFNTDINTVRGQETGYATLNPLFRSGTYSDGNLVQTTTGGNGHYRANYAITASSGKYYFEYQPTGSNVSGMIGLCEETHGPTTNLNGAKAYSYYGATGYKQGGPAAVDAAYGATFTFGDVIGVAFDTDNNTLEYFKNGASQGVAFTSFPNYPYYPAFSAGSSSNTVTYNVNFGQKPFKFPPPEGFQPINAASARPDTVIARPDQYVRTTLYTGNGTGQSINTGQKPDFVWIKNRTDTTSHMLFDSVRGIQKVIYSNAVTQEQSAAISVTAFNRDGFTVSSANEVNGSSDNIVAWTWKAGGNKNTFNVDDVGYANASDVGMSVGALNNTINKTQLWSGLFTLSAGTFDQAVSNAFNGAISSSTRARTGDNAILITMTLSTPVTVSSQVKVFAQEGYTSNCTVTVGGTTHTSLAAAVHTFNVSGSLTLMTLVTTSGSGRTYFEGMEIDGKLLVDSNVSINIPSIAATGASVGTKQGFSIIEYTGAGAAKTINHGMNKVPRFMLVKRTDANASWAVYHAEGGNTKVYELNTGGTGSTSSTVWNSTTPTSSVFSIGDYADSGGSSNDYIAYLWADVPGLQKFGKWTNNNSNSGTFTELGFRPAILLLKDIDGGEQWYIIDNKRQTFNISAPSNSGPNAVRTLQPSSTNSEATADNSHPNTTVDFLSNGFKIYSTNTSSGEISYGTRNYISAAWAEAPVSGLYGAQSNAR